MPVSSPSGASDRHFHIYSQFMILRYLTIFAILIFAIL